MGMNVNSHGFISSNQNSYGAYKQKLTNETKQKLLENNIPFSPQTTEEEGRKLLVLNAEQNKIGKNKNQEDNTPKDSLKDKAIALAKKVGVDVQNEDFEAILNKIEAKLQERLQASTNDISAIRELRSLGLELSNLQAQASGSMGYDNNNQVLIKSLEMIGEYNKNFLNL